MSSPTRYKLNLIFFTYRPGSFDMLVNSLKQQTYDNYDLIVVDDMPGRNLTDYIEDNGIPLAFYGPSKPKCYPDTCFNQVNAINTGILQADGDITVLIEDYAWLRPKTLERWCQVFDEVGPDTLVTGVGRYLDYKPPQSIGEITVWDKPFTEEDLAKCTFKGMWTPEVFEFFYSGVSVPAWEHINGMDERLDYWNTWPAQIFPTICMDAGLKFYRDDFNVIDLIDHRMWSFGDKLWWWVNYTQKGQQKYHPEEIPWTTYAQNCFNVHEDRRKRVE